MNENPLPPNAMFMTASHKPIIISSTSMQRAEQIMSQAATKATGDQFDDDVDDDELCRACDQCDEVYQASQFSQQTDYSTQMNSGSLKRKRLGVSTTPKERRAMLKK